MLSSEIHNSLSVFSLALRLTMAGADVGRRKFPQRLEQHDVKDSERAAPTLTGSLTTPHFIHEFSGRFFLLFRLDVVFAH